MSSDREPNKFMALTNLKNLLVSDHTKKTVGVQYTILLSLSLDLDLSLDLEDRQHVNVCVEL